MTATGGDGAAPYHGASKPGGAVPWPAEFSLNANGVLQNDERMPQQVHTLLPCNRKEDAMASVPQARSRPAWIWLLGLLSTAAVSVVITHALQKKAPAPMPAAEAIRQRPAALFDARVPSGADSDAQAIDYGPTPRVSSFVAGPRPTISLVSLR